MDGEDTMSPRTSSKDRSARRIFALRGRLFTVILALGLIPLLYHTYRWTREVYSSFVEHRPDRLLTRQQLPSLDPEERKSEILRHLNTEIERDLRERRQEESWLLARVDNLWQALSRRFFSAEHSQRQRRAPAPKPPAHVEALRPPPLPAPSATGEEPPVVATHDVLPGLLALAGQPAMEEESRSGEPGSPPHSSAHSPHAPRIPRLQSSLLSSDVEPAATGPARWLYRFEPVDGVRTRSLICQINPRLQLEGTVEATPTAVTDIDLSDFGFRTVHALAFLRDRPVSSSLFMGGTGVDSGYPVSYALGLNFDASPCLSLRFDYSYEAPNAQLIEYRGSWESSLLTEYEKNSDESVPTFHNFFFGMRYLLQEKEAEIPLQTGFFYTTSMDDDPLLSEVSLGFTIGGGIVKKDLRLGVTYRFRVWNSPEEEALQGTRGKDLGTRMANQFLFTLTF